MELRQLEYFLMVSQCGSFTRAADQLFVSQPAVTSAVRSLETELGICLFDRSQKQARLTMEGEVFRRHVENVMQDVSRTMAEVTALKNLNAGLLHFCYSPRLDSPPLAETFCRFHQNYPEIRFSFVEDSSSKLEKLLIDDKIDFALLLDTGKNSRLNYRELPEMRIELAFVTASDHPLARRNSVDWRELAAEEFILPLAECNYRRFIEQTFAAHGVNLTIIAEGATFETMKLLTAAGLGTTILPLSSARDDRRLAAIPFASPVYAPVFLAQKIGHQLSYASAAMFSLLGADNAKGAKYP